MICQAARDGLAAGLSLLSSRAMIDILRNPTYAKLFAAHSVAVLGTGMLTIALSLLAFDLAGNAAGTVLGTALAIKMVAYVCVSPIANAIAERLPRKALLVGADLVRAGIALALPFIDAIWQVYALVFVLQSSSAVFTPAYQATIPDILEDERSYTRALSLSRLAYELENLLSPALAGLLLLVMTYHGLFVGTFLGFVASAALVCWAAIPPRRAQAGDRPFAERLTRGTRIYLATPRLRGLLALNLSATAAGAFILVDTVVVVRAGYGAAETDLAVAFAAFGAGSMAAALLLPRLLDSIADRPVMVVSALLLALATAGFGLWWSVNGLPEWSMFLLAWATLGILFSAVVTPSGRLLRRSVHAEDRTAIFAAQFALSHACWLVTYLIAGWAGGLIGLPMTMVLLGGLALLGALIAQTLWPVGDPTEVEHDHADLDPNHPHIRRGGRSGRRHSHVFVIDDQHRSWPARSRPS